MKHPAKLRLRLRGAAALLALLALAAGAVFALRGRAQAAEWAFEPEPGQVFAAFGNSFAACSSTQLQIYGPEGEPCLRAELPHLPVIGHCRNQAVSHYLTHWLDYPHLPYSPE